MRIDQLPQGAALLMPDMLLQSRERVVERLRYRVDSTTDFRFGLNETPVSLRSWLELPTGYNPKTLVLAGRWRAEESDDAKLVERALRMFNREAFHYTLKPPLLGRDSADDFLFRTRAGFCEHYASAFVVLMRALDIPARVVTGYQGGELNPVDGWWIVRQADAHAWAEVWMADRGWMRVDPTAAIAPERIERGSRVLRSSPTERPLGIDLPLLADLRFNLDALSNAWNQWVLSYDHGRQQRLLASLGLAFDDWGQLVGVLAVGMALMIGAVALITLRPNRPRDPVARSYDEFCRRLAAAGVRRAPHKTSHRLLERVEHDLDASLVDQARGIVTLYNALRYGPPGGDPRRDVRHLRSLVHAFKP